ncbi:glutamate--tRNA ligase [Kitasatospora sp. NPDC048545]|uniref:glutamate--tRNA ligase n=1 Tax=Kitasatospora sp. NPDC048545 TaxID=3157208 RepID=UPI0033C6EAD3
MVGPSLKRPLSVGALRIALFNYAFAVSRGGSFGVRIEDTDQTRMDAHLLDDLYAMLEWTGIAYHEGGTKGGARGPYLQSGRLALYRAYAETLLKTGAAYRCFCSPELLAEVRAHQRSKGMHSRYDGRCAETDPDKGAQRAENGHPHVVRMRVPRTGHGDVVIRDEVMGLSATPLPAIDDQILIKSDGFPTYHFSSVIDDHLMGISHVLRSDSWLSSTPKHVLLYEAFGWNPPRFAHIPAIARGIWSTPVRELRDLGVPADAVVNFAAEIGWQPPLRGSLFVLNDLLADFDLAEIRTAQRNAAASRLEWLSAQHLRRQPEEEAAGDLLLQLRALGLPEATPSYRRAVIRLCRSRCRTYRDIAVTHGYMFQPPCHSREAITVLRTAETLLPEVSSALQELDTFTPEAIERRLRVFSGNRGLALGSVLGTLRLAICGVPTSPDIFEVLALLGRSECQQRLAAIHVEVRDA